MRNRFPRNCRIQLGSLENVVLLTGDRKFESISLQRRVCCEPERRHPLTVATLGMQGQRSRSGLCSPETLKPVHHFPAPGPLAAEGGGVDCR
jgi:hypothetical protein